MEVGSPPPPSAPPPTGIQEEIVPDDCFKILVASDNHIGAHERDPVRSYDSINAFKEILQLAVENEVDMLLLGGDLFHENKPSPASLFRTFTLLRNECMNDRPISIEILSDYGMGVNPNAEFPVVNYEDENLNVGLPIFTIHGNHDDPQKAGPDGALCALDNLSAAGYINYFGRQELPGNTVNDEEARDQGLQIKPVLLKKGNSKLALYGIGNIRDERFHAEMRNRRITMYRPTDDTDEWFNLLLIHQNRSSRGGPTNYVPESAFGDEVDLIIWGHEHECRIEPEPVGGKQYYISQPGSSVATSLSQGESVQKQVGLLKIQGRNFMMEPIPLRSVRPFIMETLVLEDEQERVKLDNKKAVNTFLKSKVEDLIAKAKSEWEARNDGEDEMLLPLIRLSVDITGNFEVGNPQRFGLDFENRVANPREILSIHRRRQGGQRKPKDKDKAEADAGAEEQDNDRGNVEAPERVNMESLVLKFLQGKPFQVFDPQRLHESVESYAEKDNVNAIKEFMHESIEEGHHEIEGNYELAEGTDEEREISKRFEAAKEKLSSKREKNQNQNEETGRENNNNEDDSDFGRISSDDNNSNNNNNKKQPSKTGTTSKQKQLQQKRGQPLFASDSEDDENENQVRRNTGAKGNTKSTKSGSAVSSSSTNQNPKKPTTRGRGKKSYAEDDMEEDDNDSDGDDVFVISDSEENAPPPSSKKSSTRTRKR